MDLCTLTENGFLQTTHNQHKGVSAKQTGIVNLMGNKPCSFPNEFEKRGINNVYENFPPLIYYYFRDR